MGRKLSKTKKTFVLLLILRFVLTLIPQSGYIHPDEFFQSAEIIAGDVLDLEILRTWEFNCTSPMRSIVLPYLTIGLPIWVLRSFSAITPYTVLVAPRLLVAILSTATDVFLHRIFLPRTLSNSFEYVLFSATIFLAIKHLNPQSKGPNHWDTRFLAAVMTIGFFNRPTFLFFAFVPGLAWLYSISTSKVPLRRILGHLVRFTVTFLFTSSIFIFFDSYYYQCAQTRTWVLTPLNFLTYNSDTSKLDLHGLHPRVTHILVNGPMLFGVLGIAGYLALVRRLRVTFARKRSRSRAVPREEGFLMACFLVPVLLLSTVPHQEARFIIPVLFPLVLFASNTITRNLSLNNKALCAWITLNTLGVLFFGFLHQGGVIPALFHLEGLDTGSRKGQVIFYRTYMPPRHLLLMDRVQPKYSVQDVMGGSLDSLRTQLGNFSEGGGNVVLLVSPTSLRDQIQDSLPGWRLRLVKRFPWHVSTEDFPRMADIPRSLGLDIHEFTAYY